jgi:hypothetical protein
MNERDDTDRDLDEIYRRASAEDAGRPSTATSAAILAEARRQAAARRQVAANETRFSRPVLVSAAASLVLAGVALLLWRDAGRDPTAAAGSLALERGVETPREEVAADSRESLQPPEVMPAPAQPSSEKSAADAEAPATRSFVPSPPFASAAAPPQVARRAEAREDDESLVEREFPGTLAADAPPRGVWLVRDAGGRTIRSGTLAEDESFGELSRHLQQELPDRNLSAFEVRTVTGRNGAVIQVGIATTR